MHLCEAYEKCEILDFHKASAQRPLVNARMRKVSGCAKASPDVVVNEQG